MRTKIIPVLFLTAATVVLAATAISWMKPGDGPSAADIRLSISKSLSILQTSGYKFTVRAKLHCASCHHNTMTSMLEEKSKLKGIAFVDTFKTQRIESMVGNIRFACNINQPDLFVPAKFIAPYVLMGLAAEKYQPDPYTEGIVITLLKQHWPNTRLRIEVV